MVPKQNCLPSYPPKCHARSPASSKTCHKLKGYTTIYNPFPDTPHIIVLLLHPIVPPNMGMGQYLLDTFLVGWTSIYQLFLGFTRVPRVLTHPHMLSFILVDPHHSPSQTPIDCRYLWLHTKITKNYHKFKVKTKIKIPNVMILIVNQPIMFKKSI